MRLGVALPQYRIDVEHGSSPWVETLRRAVAAEALGLGAVWLSDHPFAVGPDGEASGAIEPLVTAAALARHTKRIRIGTLVLAATMRSPALVAHSFRTIASGAPGRIVAGTGAGWYEPEHRAFGVVLPSYRDRVGALEATLVALESSRAIRLCGGTGAAAIEVAVRHADAWNVAWDPPPETFAALSARVDDACARAGRHPRTLARSVGLTVLVADDERGLDAAVDRLRGRAGFLAGVDRADLAERVVCGTPEAVAERIASYRADEAVIALVPRDDSEMLEVLARDVAPLIRERSARL